MQPFFAMIVPISDIGQPGNPPGIWGGGGVPMPNPPIANVPGAPGYQPPGGGGNPPGIWGPGSGFPSNPIPIYPGGTPNPPGIWGPNPGFPTPPIVIPPTEPGQPPLVIWGGGNQPFPTPPIELPDGGTPPVGGEPVRLVEWKTAWTEETGWVVIGVPQVPVPTPSAK